MPRRRMMDYMAMRDGRNPYGSEGGYVESRRMRRRMRGRDRAMGQDYGDYEMDMARGGRGRGRGGDRAGSDYGDMARGSGNYGDRAGGSDYARGDRAGGDYGDYESDMARGGRGRDRASDYEGGDMARRGGRDGHYSMGGAEMYYPIEAMGYFNGYYGMGDQDFARGGRGGGRGRGRDRASDYDMDYGYDMARGGRRDYGDYAGDYADYGDSLTKEEMEEWRKKLDKEVGDEQSKNFFKKENIEQKAKQLGVEMKQFGAEELALASYILYSDYCKSLKPYVGQSMDVFVKMGAEFLNDPDSAVKGKEKLALYFDIVSGEDD